MKRILLAIVLSIVFAGSMNAQFLRGRFQQDSLERIYLEIPIIDMPYQHDVASATGNTWTAITNQSMATTLALCEDLHVASHFGIRKLLGDRKWSRLAEYGWDFVEMYLPFGSSWGHEEYHRAVMGLRGVESFDEVWLMKFFASSISVSHETDEALAAMHDGYINDFIRMNSAGLEAQTHLVQSLQRNDFFYHRNLMSEVTYWMNILNNWGYIDGCADEKSDADLIIMNSKETEIKSRDFTGYDLSAWSYELFHPGVKYSERGEHPSGNGINRYIFYSQIGDDGVAYLKKQAKRELINLLSPMMFGFQRFRIMNTKNGPVYGNFAARHYLTHFGDDISLDLMLETPKWKLVAAPHMYSNYVSYFPGFEVGVVDKTFKNERIRMNASAKVWSQPEGFNEKSGKFGGMVSADAAYSFGRFEPYLELCGKTAGWAVGEVNLDSAFSCRAGVRWLLFSGK